MGMKASYMAILFAVVLGGCGVNGYVVPMADGQAVYTAFVNDPQAVGLSQAVTIMQDCRIKDEAMDYDELSRKDLTNCDDMIYKSPSSTPGVVESVAGQVAIAAGIGTGLAYSGDSSSVQQSNSGGSSNASVLGNSKVSISTLNNNP